MPPIAVAGVLAAGAAAGAMKSARTSKGSRTEEMATTQTTTLPEASAEERAAVGQFKDLGDLKAAALRGELSSGGAPFRLPPEVEADLATARNASLNRMRLEAREL